MGFKRRKIIETISSTTMAERLPIHSDEDDEDTNDAPSSLIASGLGCKREARGGISGGAVLSRKEEHLRKADDEAFMVEETAKRDLRAGAEASFAAVDTKGGFGPTRGQGISHIRKITRVDYNPEICKDYKETGYCGYGDTCIYIHDRSNYKEGWQIEREWEEKQKRIREKQRKQLEGLSISSDSDDDSDDVEDEEDLPFACLSCRKNWDKLPTGVAPVVTLCNHYFCERCAMKNYREDSACVICKEPTQGIFNMADNLIRRVHAASKRKEDKRKDEDSVSTSSLDSDGSENLAVSDDEAIPSSVKNEELYVIKEEAGQEDNEESLSSDVEDK